MKTNTAFPIAPLFFLILLTSCDPIGNFEPTNEVADIALKENYFSCDQQEQYTVPLHGAAMDGIHFYEDLVILNFIDRLVIRDRKLTRSLFDDIMQVNDIISHNGQFFLCADSGIFKGDLDLDIKRVYAGNCRQMGIGPAGELLFIPKTAVNLSMNAIYELDLDLEEVNAHTPTAPTDSEEKLLSFAIDNRGDIWANNTEGKLNRYRNRAILNRFDQDNSPLNLANVVINDDRDTDPFNIVALLPYKEGIVVVNKTQVKTFQILKFSGEQWIK